MSRYFFHLHNDTYTQDEEGRECASLEDARLAAIEEAKVMAASSVADGHLNLSHWVEVTDAQGRQALVVRFGDAIEIRS